jgi:hypothetical protein
MVQLAPIANTFGKRCSEEVSMGRLTVRLPDGLHQQLELLARNEGVSLNQYLVYALTRQATLDAYLKSERENHSAQTVPSSTANDKGEPEEIRHLHGGGLPPPAGT